jgi:hypothetical protein
MRSIEHDVAVDALRQYEISKTGGDPVDVCVHAGLVSAAYLQAKDEIKFPDGSLYAARSEETTWVRDALDVKSVQPGESAAGWLIFPLEKRFLLPAEFELLYQRGKASAVFTVRKTSRRSSGTARLF